MIAQTARVRIPDRFSLVSAGPGEYRLHSLTFSLALRDSSSELLARLLPLIDGHKTVGDLSLELEPFGREAVHQALGHLLEAGALELVDAGEPGALTREERERFQAQIAFFSHFVAPAGALPDAESYSPRSGLDYQARVKAAHVAVFGLGRIGSQLVKALSLAGLGSITAVDSEPVEGADLCSDGWFGPEQKGRSRATAVRDLTALLNPTVRVTAESDPADLAALQELLTASDFAVLCRDHLNPAEYETFNRATLATNVPWTSARLAGFEFHIGPTVIPYETSCYTCANLRLKSNLPDFDEYRLVEEFLNTNRLVPETLAFTPGATLVALEVLKGISRFTTPATCSHVYSLNLLTMESRLHPVLKIPRCPACGRPAQPRPTIHAWQQAREVSP